MIKKYITLSFAIFLGVILLSAGDLAAAVTKLNGIRSWQHKGYTRLVMDAEGGAAAEYRSDFGRRCHHCL